MGVYGNFSVIESSDDRYPVGSSIPVYLTTAPEPVKVLEVSEASVSDSTPTEASPGPTE